MAQEQWLALNLGNSRLHGGVFVGHRLIDAWDAPYDRLPAVGNFSQVLIASVNRERLTPWHGLPSSRILTLEDVPLPNKYATMGIDRALAAWGAWRRYREPLLIIDCGTAITLTSIDGTGRFAGGAIFPGLELLCQCLPQRVRHLPPVTLPPNAIPLWAETTPDAMASGVFHFVKSGLTQFINDRGWLTLFTGGDGKYWQQFFPHSQFDPHLVFWGMAEIKLKGWQRRFGEQTKFDRQESS